MAASLSNRSRAMRNPTTHILARGRGYIDLGEAPQLARAGMLDRVHKYQYLELAGKSTRSHKRPRL